MIFGLDPNLVKHTFDICDCIGLRSIEDKEVRILIGSDVPEAFWVLEKRRGGRGEPYAIRSPLGLDHPCWAVIGPTEPVEDRENQFSANFIRIRMEEDMLFEQVKGFWETDFGRVG